MSETQIKEIFLHPGEYVMAGALCRITTLLGSCVAITLWHPARRVGAMSHFLLASRGPRKRNQLDGRYGDEALALMLEQLTRLNVPAHECQAKLFGGGRMFPQSASSSPFNVGLENGQMARQLLQANGIALMSESLFGVGHRRIVFDVGSGEVLLQKGKLFDAGRL